MKNAKKLLSFITSPFFLGMIVTGVITVIAVRYYETQHGAASKEDRTLMGLIHEIHEKTIDWRLRDRGVRPGSDRVAILAIDEKSIELEGRWPWPRAKIASLVDRAIDSGAKSVSFDIIFSEEDTNSSLPTLSRLQRALSDSNSLTDEARGMLTKEIEQADADRSFANVIKQRADNLIMGSYYEDNVVTPPAADLCVDAHFERTAESKYWSKEAQPLVIIDEPLSRLTFPRQIKEHLAQYFTLLEVTSATEWFEAHKEIGPRITFALDEYSSTFPPETYPGLATLWLNDDIESAKTLLEATVPQNANIQGVRRIFDKFGSAFTKKDKASLQVAVRNTGLDYCERMFSERDELLHKEAYTQRWGESEDSIQQFDALNWQAFWSQIQSEQKGANPEAPAQETLESAIARLSKDSLVNRVPQVGRWWVNIPLLAEGTKHSGYFNAVQDTDGSIRRSVLIVRRGNSYMPSLALKTFLVDEGLKAKARIAARKSSDGETTVKALASLEILDEKDSSIMKIPVDPQGNLMVNFAGGRNMFPYVSAADILSDSPQMNITVRELDPKSGRWRINENKKVDKAAFLKDKILIAGATAMGVYDLRVTPFEENYPGVETHANVLSNLLTEFARARGDATSKSALGFLRTHPDEARYMWIALVGLGLLLSALLSYFGSVTGLGITALAVGCVYVVDRYFLFKNGYVATTFFPIALITGNFVTLTFYKYFTEERKKRELKGTFEKYVSPAIVAEVLSDPENIELGGKKMELTVMFSDVRGFTTISEKLDPRALSDLLNSYLTPMTDLVFKNKGTLDKYMGDAIMAFWGAPIHFEDHAKHACRCALQMLGKLKELQESYRAKGLPEIDVGIGLNTGEMSVGNMGSDTVRSYTVMGDAVNLGSRLEGINKQYGTRIIISEFTYNEVKDSFITREVDWVRVKGKAQPVRIFELVAEGNVPEETSRLLQHFDQGFRLYHERKFKDAIDAFTLGLNIKPDDAVTQLYIERCQDYLTDPPPENWDGVFTMTSK